MTKIVETNVLGWATGHVVIAVSIAAAVGFILGLVIG